MSDFGAPTRREWLGMAAAGLAATPIPSKAAEPQRIPLKIAHRASNMRLVGSFEIFKVVRQMPGLAGVELQSGLGTPNLHDLQAVRRYKEEANRWGLLVPSLAGVWQQGKSIRSPEARGDLEHAIRAAELLGSRVILVAAYKEDCPDLSKESSYGPVVALLSAAAVQAADAGVVLGIETSLDPQGHAKLVDMVGSPAVKVYYDVHNMASYGHSEQAISGIAMLGKHRICQVHVKNQARLIEEPGLIDWAAAFRAFNEIGYEGWYAFETQHKDRQQMLDATERNIAFLQKHCVMPAVAN